ncbi:MAG TPA: hypothetical protein PKD83_14425, partial [Ignavibacteria bacterium]|nr:hypothetical protein [Ignavibacteria bacterium]
DKWYKQTTPTSEDLYFIMSLGYWDYISGGRNGIFLRTIDGGGAVKRFITNSSIEGFYNPFSNTMIGDSISVTLRSAASPYYIIEKGKDKLNNAGFK